MPTLCDFIEIIGNKPVTIGDGRNPWQGTFDTGGRREEARALLIFNVRGLTYAQEGARVEINEEEVGTIVPYSGKDATAHDWHTQMISVSGSTIKDSKKNRITIHAALYPGTSAGNAYDDFDIKNLVCFFHQHT